MKRTTLVGLSLAAALTVLGLVGLVVFKRQVRDVWQTARDYRQMRRDLPEGRRFPQVLADAKAQGLPTTAAELQKPLPPPKRNAAPIYVRLRLLLKAHPFTTSEAAAMVLHPGVTPLAAQWSQISQLLHDRSEELSLVHQAASRPDCVFTRNWATPDPAEIQFPELATIRTAAYLLRLESLLMAHQGKYEAAARNQALGFRIGQHGASDGLMIPYLVGIAGDAITFDGLKRIMTMTGPNVTLDATVSSLIARHWKPRSLSAVLRSETAFDLSDIAYLRQAGPQGMDSASGGSHAPTTLAAQGTDTSQWNIIMDYNGVFLMDEMRQAAQTADGPYPEANSALNRVDSEAMDNRHPARLLASLMLPLVGKAADKRAQIQALADVTRAGAVMLSQSDRQGHPPDHLPSAFLDPYTGKPLGYRREGAQGFVIYSAGADGHFDGGKPGEYWWKPYQVAFRYP